MNQNESQDEMSSNFKTVKCRHFDQRKLFGYFILLNLLFNIDGSCKYGDKCSYAHGDHELRVGNSSSPSKGKNQGNGQMPMRM